MREQLITNLRVEVAESEFRRLLGYPVDYEPGTRAQELAAAIRTWYGEHGQPWIYVRELVLEPADAGVNIQGRAWPSASLPGHLARTGSSRAIVFGVSAGAALETRARELWEQGKPDEYFFAETYGSAVVEHLVTRANDLICREAGAQGLYAVPHYSPGYDGWDVAEQNALFEVLTARRTLPLPEALTVLWSGMLQPKKSLLGVVGLSANVPAHLTRTPCERCTLMPCRYRRAAYRFSRTLPEASVASGAPAAALRPAGPAGPLTLDATYSLNPRALAKWADERLTLTPNGHGEIHARFRYDGTTCSNMGRPLAFEYTVALSSAESGYRILDARCAPAKGDEGHTAMCEYRRDSTALMSAIAAEQPLQGRPLDDVLRWSRPAAPSGCYCDADSRLHKWGLALETIHFALARRAAAASAQSAVPPLREPAFRA